MRHNGPRVGNTKIFYRIGDLFEKTKEISPLSVFAHQLPDPLGNTNIVLLQNGGRFDVMAWFGGPSDPSAITDPLSLMKEFARPFGILKLKPYHAYVISTPARDFVVSYEPITREFLFSTSIALIGVDARAYVIESPHLNAITFAQVFTEYTELLREFIDFIYAAHHLDFEQVIGLRVLSEENAPLKQDTFESSTAASLNNIRTSSSNVLPFVRPKK